MASFETKEITYFKEAGEANTAKAIELAAMYAKQNGINKIVIASATGKSALKLKKEAPDLEVVDITYSDAVSYEEELEEFRRNKKKLVEVGIKIVKCTHAFSGVEKALSQKYKSMMPQILIADTLKLISEGVKVAVESTLMAADVGAVNPEENILALGGTGNGVDTCILVKPATTSNFFKIGILEIICIPRYSGLAHE
jgi:hypothetical protein